MKTEKREVKGGEDEGKGKGEAFPLSFRKDYKTRTGPI